MGVQPLAWRDMVKRFRACGFDGPFYKGSHPFMKRGTHKVRIPNDHGEAISAPLIRRVIRLAEITEREWEEAR